MKAAVCTENDSCSFKLHDVTLSACRIHSARMRQHPCCRRKPPGCSPRRPRSRPAVRQVGPTTRAPLRSALSATKIEEVHLTISANPLHSALLRCCFGVASVLLSCRPIKCLFKCKLQPFFPARLKNWPENVYLPIFKYRLDKCLATCRLQGKKCSFTKRSKSCKQEPPNP